MAFNICQIMSNQFKRKQKQDQDKKDLHLKLFRPNLENPANKQITKELNEDELKRTTAF